MCHPSRKTQMAIHTGRYQNHESARCALTLIEEQISGKRRLQISEFKNMTMVNIREFYEKDGKALPGKAGINLPLEQFTTFLSLLPQVLKELESRGHTIEMPSVDRGSTSVKKDDDEVGGEEEETEKAEKAKKSTKSRKSNIEATSDEEEDE